MRVPSSNTIAWLIPVTFLIHQIEEFFLQFPIWYSTLLNAQLSDRDFLVINAIGLFVFTAASLSYLINKNSIILAALGTLIFANGIVHFVLSIFTYSYSPGTISGIFLFIPLGLVIFKKIMPRLNKREQINAVLIGVFVLFTVSIIAINI